MDTNDARKFPSSMVNMYGDICAFHEKYELEATRVPAFPAQALLEFRQKFLAEELEEFNDACTNGDLVKAFDALIDLVYVALGTAYLMNLPFDEGWKAVHQANMRKVRVERASESKRGSAFDVVKPDGWIAPEMMLQSLIMRQTYIRTITNGGHLE